MGIDAAESVQAENSIEKMLAHQMAVAHEAAMRMMDRGLSYENRNAGDQVEACRCLNAAVRLMGAFNARDQLNFRDRCGDPLRPDRANCIKRPRSQRN